MQATDVKNRVKNAALKPVIIAPTMLVAGNPTARITTEAKIVPKMPVSKTDSEEQIHSLEFSREKAATPKVRKRTATAIPNATIEKTGVNVIVAVATKIAVTTPTIIEARAAYAVHPKHL